MAEPAHHDPNGTSPETPLRIEPVRWNGEGRVALIGEIDVSNVRDIEAALIEPASAGRALTLDLLGLSYLDSQGVAMIFRLAKRARLNGGSLTLANAHGIVRRVLDITFVGDAATLVNDG